MKIKKLLVTFGAIFAILGLVACATNEKEEPTEDVVEYTVTFNYKNGNPSTATQVQEGQKVTKPADPEKADSVFKGWYKDEDFQNEWDFDNDVVTKHIILYAKWAEIEKYNITFNMHGHGVSPTSVIEATALPNPLPAVEDVEGWHFIGWYLDADCNTAAAAGKALTENTTLYAKWEGKQVTPPALEKFSISYNINGKGEQPTNVKEALALPEELPLLTESEYVFAGWYLDADFNTKATPGMVLTEDVTLYAKW